MTLRNLAIAATSALLLAACNEQPKAAGSAGSRIELKRLTGTTVQFVPTDGQLPYCLVFTISDKGVVRQLTMNRYNESVKCEPGQPIANVTFRIPADEGSIRALIVMSDQKVSAGPISQQILELKERNPKVSALDLRLPGKASTVTLDFTPESEPPTVSGQVVTATTDAGTITPPPAAAMDAGTK